MTDPARSRAGAMAAPRPPTNRSRSYARWAVRVRWFIIATWAIVLVALAVVVPRLPPGGDGLASVIPLDSPAIAAELRSVHLFGYPLSSRTVVVQRDPAGLSPFVQAESVLDAISVDQQPQEPPLLGALPITNARPLGGVSESGTTVLTYLFMDPRSAFSNQQRAAREYIDTYLDRPQDHVIGVAGSIPARAEQARLAGDGLTRLEILTVLTILLLVGLNFRSVLAPLLALGASAVAFFTTVQLSHVLGWLLGIGAPAELEPLLVALLLGVVTDYTIFYVSALKSRWQAGVPWPEAVVEAVGGYTPIIVAAGLTVAAGTAALLAAESAFFRGFGPAMALAVLVGLVVSVTLVPALIVIIGPRLFWPYAPTPRETHDRRRDPLGTLRSVGLVEHLTRRSVAAGVLFTTVGLLLLASLPLRGIALGLGFTSSLPAGNSVSRAAEASAAGFAPGITSPTTLLIEGKGVTSDLAALARLQEQVEQQPGVAGVFGPAQNVVQRDLGVVLARSGDAARMLVVLDNVPLEANAIRDLSALRERLPGLAARSGLARDVRISVAGDTALAEGLVGRTGHDLIRIGVAGILVNLFVLIVFLRALVAPLYLLACSILTLTASLGATVGLFMGVLGQESLTFYVPFAAAVLLVALGSDYNIFGVGHVWEQARHLPLRAAICKAVPESTRAIMAAGTVLAASFGLLATIPLQPFRQLGFAMSVGIMIDVLVVRSLLVPCLLTLVGPASAWPSRQLAHADQDAPQGPSSDQARVSGSGGGPAPGA